MDQSNHEVKTLWNKSFILLLVLSTFVNASSQMVTPLVTEYATQLGAELSIAATIASLMSITALFLRPVSGLFSDRYNRKTIILISNLAIMICILLMSFAKNVPTLVAVRLLHGIAFSFNGVAFMAFNTMFIPKARLGEGMGWMALSTIISQAIGPTIGGKIADAAGYSVCFVVAACICLVGIILIAIMPYKHKPADKVRKLDINSLINLRILPYAAIMGLFSAGNGLCTTFMRLFGADKGIANITLFFTAYSFAMIAIRPFSGKLVDKKGLKFVLVPSIIIASVAFFLLGQSTSLWMVVIAALLKALGQGSGSPAIQASSLKQVGVEKAGVVSSTCFIGQDVGNALAPIIGGRIAQSFGYTTMFTGYSVLLLVAGLATFYVKYNYDMKKYGSV